MTFGQKLKQLREDRDLYQKDLAKLLDCSEKSISSYERNYRKPDMETLKKISNVFDVSIDSLLGITDANNNTNLVKEDATKYTNKTTELINERSELKELFEVAKNASKEDIEKAIKIIKALK